jgi:(E)-4-hydroxy-3-methylbut-2-enyl-diphosphate synthase
MSDSEIQKRKTRAVKVGRVIVGGGFPVSVQTMWKKALSPADLPSVVSELERLSRLGCDIVRFAVPDAAAAELLGRLSRSTEMPLVADIHFDYRLALRCLDFSIAKIRINPGNIGEEWKVREMVEKAIGQGIPLRIGVNAGSLPRSLESEKDVALAMLKAAELEMEVIERLGFRDAVFSLKSSDVETTLRANALFSKTCDYPLHIGVTEAGPLIAGIVKNTLGITGLLQQGIGDTIRVSLTSPSEDEVLTGLEILRSVKLRKAGVQIISCPRCGRSSFDVQGFLEDVSEFIYSIQKPLTIAVMGCVVNGPGEAKKADIGITGAGKYAILFRHGEMVRKVPYKDAVMAFKEEVQRLCGPD